MTQNVDFPQTLEGLEHACHAAQHFAKQLGGRFSLEPDLDERGVKIFEAVYRAGTYHEVLGRDTEALVAVGAAYEELWKRADEARKKHGPRSAA